MIASATFDKVRPLIASGDWVASDHALQRVDENGIIVGDLVASIASGEPVEDYPTYHAGPCVLTLQADRSGMVHALWGLRSGTDRPAVLITAYRPDPTRWHDDHRTRRP